jgi:hypothetical protein
MSGNRLISKETMALFDAHDNKKDKLDCRSSCLPPLRKDNPHLFSYSDRYGLKERDQTKQRFCPDPRLSKQYETILKDYAHLLVKNVEIYFDRDAPSIKRRVA